MSALNIQMHIDYFADFMFVKNINNAIIDLTLPTVDNNKDMFFFLVDLICKGLILLYGINNKVDLDSLKIDDFVYIQKKLNLAGINVDLNIEEHNGNNATAHKLNLQDIEDNYEDNLDLKEYVFIINNVTHIYKIRFNLFHNSL